MPNMKKKAVPATPALEIKSEVLDELVKGPMTPEQFETMFQGLKKAIVERALGAELTHHLGYAKGEEPPSDQTNQRNGTSPKTVLTDTGPLNLTIPRDREGSFEPQLIPKGERRFKGFDEKIIAMYARGMTVREIQGYLLEMYAMEVSPDFISQVTEAVMAEVLEWQSRPLERLYPVVFFDALRVKIRDEGVVRNKAIYLALGVLPDGSRDVLGLWIEQTEGAKFWMKVVNDLKARGVEDILIAVVDGLKGFPEAIGAVFPETTVQTCIVHLIRNSLDYATWKDRRSSTRRSRRCGAEPGSR
jgi:putative transposase